MLVPPYGTLRRSAWPQKSVAIGVTADKRQPGSSINTQRLADTVEKVIAKRVLRNN
jgi:hypothetical protein